MVLTPVNVHLCTLLVTAGFMYGLAQIELDEPRKKNYVLSHALYFIVNGILKNFTVAFDYPSLNRARMLSMERLVHLFSSGFSALTCCLSLPTYVIHLSQHYIS
jgi:hypothetical protein